MTESDPSRSLIPAERIEKAIYLLRGHKVMLDRDLADLYGVETRALVQAVKRNSKRFPSDFMFQLSRQELENWRSQIVTSNPAAKMGLRRQPYAFTEHGVAMLSSVLHSPRAVQMNILIIRAFVKLREILAGSKELAHRLEAVERTLKRQGHAIALVYDEVKKLQAPPATPKRRIGFRSPDEKQ